MSFYEIVLTILFVILLIAGVWITLKVIWGFFYKIKERDDTEKTKTGMDFFAKALCAMLAWMALGVIWFILSSI